MTGRQAYEEDCRRCPNYPFGSRGVRPTWDDLDDYMQASWEKNPTPRRWQSQHLGGLHCVSGT